jgi:alkanesulfonate monooxygenase SsuD/methylene tetrahydromethanopterin reductase-like flavin-dependent oxidoreductase (luciferase family)
VTRSDDMTTGVTVTGAGGQVCRVGVLLSGFTGRVSELVRLTTAAERLEYASVWTGESSSNAAFTLLGAAIAQTSAIEIGTAIVPIFGRAPAVVAQEAATAQALSNGRFALGIGISSPVLAEWRGEAYTKPYARLREHAQIIRTLLAGERATLDGATTKIAGFKLDIESFAPPPIYIGAMGPNAVRLAGEISDGVILNAMSVRGVVQAAEGFAEGAEIVGRAGGPAGLLSRVVVVVGGDQASRLRAGQRLLAYWLSAEPYRKSFAGQGLSDQIAEFEALWDAGDRKGAAASLTEDLLRTVGVIVGGHVEAVDAIARRADVGLTDAILHLVTAGDGPSAETDPVDDALVSIAALSAEREALREAVRA